MSLSTRMRINQAHAFRMGHVTGVLQMSGEELDEHLLQTARDNPFLVVRQRRRGAIRAGGLADLMETLVADKPTGLYDHAMRELAGLMARDARMERLILGLIEELEPTGWIGRSVPEIAEKLGLGCDLVDMALTLVQKRISPTGLFARNLAECLRLQLEEQEALDSDTEAVLAHLHLLERGGPAALAQVAGLEDAMVARQLSRLRRLDPKPGTQFATDLTLTREPDVRIEPEGAGWRINFRSGTEATMAVLPKTAEVGAAEWRQAHSEARALKQALDLRQSALRKIVDVMVEVQGDFFRDGPEALQALTQTTIAERTGFHLSTVSRVLNGLLIEGPNGIVSAQALCPRSARRSGEDGAPKPKVMARLHSLLKTECTVHPLSDQRLSERLGAEGLAVSRRVVAKYRQELGFARATERRLGA
ncbi:RNA polymerase subunit sigma-54 [Ponticoccus alexandrii]|uniref:RNA polymerase sigma-54 factor n=1 Tax=Ponticoccus alexandrii TaxID=1943633 RepID=A0ABX7FFL0_9RHOB|nr:RNA polymerase subunit sigma-54 [Ponticoccus alexandrii]ETA52080.2 RNA polymerase subunit sigma-54 [Rhodobacteraceae bacterium PD-2]QRF69148.1 RNA polymerase subunit sigma-54 [Ponticoccus alexandrii]